MNIANIFGMHLGCMVRYKDEAEEYVLNQVDCEGYCVLYNVWTNDVDKALRNCRLLLTPLDKITEEDKKYLLDKYFKGYTEIKITVNEWAVATISDDYGLVENVRLAFPVKFWLRTRGYDINDGLVPDEYKEVK